MKALVTPSAIALVLFGAATNALADDVYIICIDNISKKCAVQKNKCTPARYYRHRQYQESDRRNLCRKATDQTDPDLKTVCTSGEVEGCGG
ncbi:hypothetical protein LRP30_16125 [Bradyrhizobium sp. C-145]|uniref:hypothetical protein n=1 Tax=Bradyrhizobium sp. C-145 TaxID=574727 RepID=UPI00201B5378|nr:hypothetical protein [Bradyrhizobium sp. C-145]UQR66682.1 hypothetical protein LRP30_16125 [Bradyrhizobium sp. C-145]